MFCLRGFIASASCMLLLVVVRSSEGAEIIGGKEVKPPHSLPFMALLISKDPACGGILIDPKWVLTAAHCAEIKKVWLGVHSITKDKNGQRQVHKVKQRVPHPQYDAADKVNDLMLLKLKKAAKKTRSVNWLKLGQIAKDPASGSECLVAGWGTTSNTAKKMSDVLRSVNVTVIERRKCNSPEYYNSRPVITNDMICAGSVGKNRVDTCLGDSGGPLLCNGALVGVTSFGEGCGVINKPGVYSFLSKGQLMWIRKTMKKTEQLALLLNN